VYTSHLHFQETLEIRSLLYELVEEDVESNSKAPPITIGGFGASGLHPLIMNSVGAIQSQHSKQPSLDTEEQEKRRQGEDWTVGKTQARA